METPPPVPLGTAGLAEPFDVYLAIAADDTTLDKLNAAAPDAMRFVSLTPLEDGAPKLSKRFNAVEYVVLVNRPSADVEAALEQLLGADTLVVTRARKKKKTIEADIRPYLLDARMTSEYDRTIFPSTDRPAVCMTLELPGSGGTRPSELFEQVLNDLSGDDLWIARTRFLHREAQ
jgi:radical SAM-linked protein